jgi:2-hydroxychromene-2-carboxylate isomerase
MEAGPMAKVVDYYMSPLSPWTYLGAQRFIALARAAGAEIRLKPLNTGEVFAATGGLPLAKRAPARQAYRLVELARWKRHLGLPMNIQPKHFPVPDRLAAGLIVAARQAGLDAIGLSNALLRAVWEQERDVSDPATLKTILAENGLPESLLQAAGSQAVADEIAGNTAEAIGRNVFGVPTYVYRDEPFWGQDRLDFLERALKA